MLVIWATTSHHTPGNRTCIVSASDHPAGLPLGNKDGSSSQKHRKPFHLTNAEPASGTTMGFTEGCPFLQRLDLIGSNSCGVRV